MSAAAPLLARRPAPPRPSGQATLGDPGPRYDERALLACLLADPRQALLAIKATSLRREDVSAELGAVIGGIRDLLRAGELVNPEVVAATLKERGVPAPGDYPGWHSYLTDCGLPDFDPERWCRRLRARALRRRLVPAAQAAADRYPGALERLAELVNELRCLGGAA